MKLCARSLSFGLVVLGTSLCAQPMASVATVPPGDAAQLEPFTVFSPRVANQTPAAIFAMPVSALRFEPLVDLQGRSVVEGQADMTIRGGIFENTGLRIGASTLVDPQTGHYLAETPVAPQMLGAPRVLTGAAMAGAVTNATVGAVAYGWRPIRTGGLVEIGAGPHDMWRGDAYAAYTAPAFSNRAAVGADVDVAHAESNGPIAFGDYRFDRSNARVQLKSGSAQTDLFVGYQAKFFGWPNMYTPFNSNESENLETLLVAANHRVDWGGGDYFETSLFHRRNKDDYAFNRFAPLGPVHPFQHTTWEDGAAAELRRDVGEFVFFARGELLTDFLKSTSLTAGRYHSRTLTSLSLIPEKSWRLADGVLTARAGATYDDSNRDSGELSPVVEVERTFTTAAITKVYASYAQTSQAPSYTALNSSATSGLFRGNPALGREISRNFEIGATSTMSGWTTNAAVFARRDHSLVDWTFRRGVTARTANAVDVDTLGGELVARRSWSAVDLVVGYTALTKDPDYRGAAVDASFYALNYAKHRLTAAITARLGHGFEVRMDNVARIQAANLLRTVGGDEAVLSSLALAYRPAALRNLELSFQVDNLWNSHFQEIPAVPATPRLWSIGARYAW